MQFNIKAILELENKWKNKQNNHFGLKQLPRKPQAASLR